MCVSDLVGLYFLDSVTCTQPSSSTGLIGPRRCLLQVLPGCLLLHFAAADLQEGEGNIEAARQVYQELLPYLNPDGPLAAPPTQVPCLCQLSEQPRQAPPPLFISLTKHMGCMAAWQYNNRSQY